MCIRADSSPLDGLEEESERLPLDSSDPIIIRDGASTQPVGRSIAGESQPPQHKSIVQGHNRDRVPRYVYGSK